MKINRESSILNYSVNTIVNQCAMKEQSSAGISRNMHEITVPKAFSLKVLGPPQLFLPMGLSKVPAKGLQLLGLLCRAERHQIQRRTVASILWDSESDHHAFTNLRQLMTRMRKLSPDDPLIISDSRFIALGETFRCTDLAAFEAAVEKGGADGLRAALDLFNGDFLYGCDENVTSEFEDWLHHERARIRESFFFCATSLLYNSTKFGRADRGLIDHVARRMLELEPEREETYRVLIEVYGRVGMQSDARRVYESLVDMMRIEHGAEPTPETVQTARKVFATAVNDANPQVRAVDRAQPRVAILMPEWIAADVSLPMFRALMGDVANELARFRSFSILGPHTSLKIAHDFGVPHDNALLQADYSISGFVVSSDEKTTLKLRLGRCDTGEIVWAAELSFSNEELYLSQRMLVLRIVSSLASEIERERARVHKVMRVPDAYVGFLAGMDCMAVCDLPNLRRARRKFSESLEIDPTFAAAHAGIARSLLFEWLLLGADSPEVMAQAKKCANLALELDPDDAQIVSTSASVDLHQHDIPAALEQFADAEALSPHSGELLVGYANALSMGGEPRLGLEKFEKAVSLDPLQPDDRWWAGASIAFSDKQYERAIGYCGQMQNDEAALRVLTASHALAGNSREARACGRRLREIYPDQSSEEMVRIAPITIRDVANRFLEGLRIAGL